MNRSLISMSSIFLVSLLVLRSAGADVQPVGPGESSDQQTTDVTAAKSPASESPATASPPSESPAGEAPGPSDSDPTAPPSEQPPSEQPSSEQPSSEQPSSEQPSSEQPSSVESATPTWLLRYQFTSGQKLRYLTLQTATMDAAREDQRKSDRSEVEQRRLFTVERIDEGGVAHIAMQFEFVRMQLQANGGTPVVFRSDMKPAEIPKMFQLTADRLRGSAARYQVLATGESDPNIEKVVRTVANSEAKQKSEAGTFLMPLAAEPVAIGDTWKDTQVVNVRVTEDIDRRIEILRTFRLEDVTNDIATIKFSSSIISPVHSPAIRAQLIQSTPRGTLQFDIARGTMVRKDLKFDQTVINGAGENTVVSSYGTYVEELLDEPQAEATTSAATPAENSSAAVTAIKSP